MDRYLRFRLPLAVGGRLQPRQSPPFRDFSHPMQRTVISQMVGERYGGGRMVLLSCALALSFSLGAVGAGDSVMHRANKESFLTTSIAPRDTYICPRAGVAGAEYKALRLRGGSRTEQREDRSEEYLERASMDDSDQGDEGREYAISGAEELDLEGGDLLGAGNVSQLEMDSLQLAQDGEGDLDVVDGEYIESSDSEKVDEDGMPFNPNFTEINASQTTSKRGCRHYSRGCKLVAPCCNREFWCRHCHNEEMDTGCTDPKKAHQIDRFAIKEVVCGDCSKRQPLATNCTACGNQFGNYFCPTCVFFDDDTSKEVFHCVGCGICRVGGESNFFHCVFCGCCYALQLKDNHKCIAGAMHHNCPVCLEDLFHSTSQVRVLRCGHTLHKKCLDQLLRRPTALHICPLCSKTLNDHSFTWHQLDVAVSQTPMPTEYLNTTVAILCNDCHTQGNVTFHVYGLKCPNELCGGYNTRRIMQ